MTFSGEAGDLNFARPLPTSTGAGRRPSWLGQRLSPLPLAHIRKHSSTLPPCPFVSSFSRAISTRLDPATSRSRQRRRSTFTEHPRAINNRTRTPTVQILLGSKDIHHDVGRSMAVPISGADKRCQPLSPGILHYHVQRLGMVGTRID